MEWYRKNSEMYYVVKQDGIVVGFLGIIPIKRDVLEKMMQQPGLNEEAEDILPFVPSVPVHGVFLEIGVRSDIPKNRKYGRHLIEGGFNTLEDFARRGIIIEKAYAHSRTPDGIKLCRKIGFNETLPVDGDTRMRFEINLRKTNYPLLKGYQVAAAQYEHTTQKGIE